MKLRVCVFEDDPLVRRLLEMALTRRGYEVHDFPHPLACPLTTHAECACAAENACVDAVLSDVNMPGMSGLEFVERQRRKGCKCRHYALMSGGWTPEQRAWARALGCALLTKPFSLRDLNEWLDEVGEATPPERTLADWPPTLAATP